MGTETRLARPREPQRKVSGNLLTRRNASLHSGRAITVRYEELRRDPVAALTRVMVHFPANELPPVNAFWSLTVYDATTQLLVVNPINRYLINSPMVPDLKKDADGGITLYLQAESPGADKEANCLRTYLPKDEILDGQWQPPAMEREG